MACCDAVLNSNHLIRNNLVFNNGSGNLVGLTGASQSNNLTCNPGFVNADAGDFHLTAGSCAIDQGATLPEASPDYDGVARSAPYEVGAFEFGGGGVTLSMSPTSVAAGGTGTATWAGIPSPTALDWLGLYTPGQRYGLSGVALYHRDGQWECAVYDPGHDYPGDLRVAALEQQRLHPPGHQ